MKVILKTEFNSTIDVFFFSVYRILVTEIKDTSVVAFHNQDQVRKEEN